MIRLKLPFRFYFLLIAGFNCKAQPIINNSISYIDLYGNTITIENIDKLPNQLDTTFFRLNLSSLYFNKEEADTILRFDYFVDHIKTTRRNREFELLVRSVPRTKNIEEILKHLGGYTHYFMMVKKVHNKFQIISVDALYSDI